MECKLCIHCLENIKSLALRELWTICCLQLGQQGLATIFDNDRCLLRAVAVLEKMGYIVSHEHNEKIYAKAKGMSIFKTKIYFCVHKHKKSKKRLQKKTLDPKI